MKPPNPALPNILFDTSNAFRLGLEGEANELFTGLLDALENKLQSAPADDLTSLSLLLTEILTAQQRQDYLLIADLLEYQLAPALSLG